MVEGREFNPHSSTSSDDKRVSYSFLVGQQQGHGHSWGRAMQGRAGWGRGMPEASELA